LTTPASADDRPEHSFLGLAPFLRLSIAGADLRPRALELLAAAEGEPGDANLLMNVATVMFCLGQRDLALSIQAQALALRRTYHLAAARQPARLRLLMLAAPGDLGANTPIDCLLEDSDIDLDIHYVDAGQLPALAVPDHDIVMVGIGAGDDALLRALESALAQWPKPVINAPQRIPATERSAASRLLSDAPGLLMPPTLTAKREHLHEVAVGGARLSDYFDGCDFPVILRPLDSHGGHDLDRIAGRADLAAYLGRVNEPRFYLSPFIDYSGSDGLFRKYRVALIDGAPFACHMGVSSHWMIHYVNAGMYEDTAKRAEEAAFMAHFDDFARRHGAALAAIRQRTGLDYLCLDCAQSRDGRLLIFEIDHVMVVHAMDPEDLFPYKRAQMRQVADAFRNLLLARA
jgi:glutathione synthase/RimK-type ligase-like ATP-grasp enzyme